MKDTANWFLIFAVLIGLALFPVRPAQGQDDARQGIKLTRLSGEDTRDDDLDDTLAAIPPMWYALAPDQAQYELIVTPVRQRKTCTYTNWPDIIISRVHMDVTLIDLTTQDEIASERIMARGGCPGTSTGRAFFTASPEEFAAWLDQTLGATIKLPDTVIEVQTVPSPYVAYSPDGRFFVTHSDVATILWDAPTGDALRRLPRSVEVRDLVFSPDSQQIAVLYRDRLLSIQDIESGTTVREIATGALNAKNVFYSAEGQQIMVDDPDHELRVWDTASGEIAHTIPQLESGGRWDAAALSRDGRTIATTYIEPRDWTVSAVYVWDVASGDLLFQVETPEQNPRVVALSPDGRLVFAATQPGAVLAWDIASGEPVYELPHAATVTTFAFSPDGRYVVTGGDGVYLWELESGAKIAEMAYAGPVNDVQFSPDGREIAIAGMRVWRWDVSGLVTISLALDCPATVSDQVVGVYLRAEPAEDADQTGTAMGGAAVTVTAQEGDWFAIDTGDSQGWVSGDVLVMENCP